METLGLYKVQILFGVQVGLIRLSIEMQLVVITIELIEVIHGDLVVQLLTKTNACFVSPTSGNVLDGVATTSKHKHRDTPRLHMLHAFSMSFDSRVVVTKSIISKRVCSALDDYSVRSELLSHFFNDLQI